MKSLQKTNIDFLIIGGGPAGISAAIQAARLGLATQIVERNCIGGQARIAPWIENYPGFPEGIKGSDLMDLFVRQLEKWKVPILFDDILSLERNDGVFLSETNGAQIKSRCVLLAIGLTPKLVGIEGEIPYGDPSNIDHKDRSVLVIGSGDSTFDLAASFSEKARSVTIGMRSKFPKALPKLVEQAFAKNVQIKTDWFQKDINYDVIVSCIGKEVCHPLISKVIESFGEFDLKPGAVEKIAGFFLAGDLCRGNDRHVSIAAGDGLTAAQAAYRFLKEGPG